MTAHMRPEGRGAAQIEHPTGALAMSLRDGNPRPDGEDRHRHPGGTLEFACDKKAVLGAGSALETHHLATEKARQSVFGRLPLGW